MLKLGIIGVGNIGSSHVERVIKGECPGVTITAVADRRESRRAWAKDKAPEAQIFVEGSELIASGCCDAVLIATPHYQHPILAQEAFEHGQHVLCEKPAGVYTLQVVFDPGSDTDLDQVLTNMRYGQAQSQVPTEVLNSGAMK